MAVGRMSLLALLLLAAGCTDLTDTHRWSSMRIAPGDNTEAQVRFYAAPSPPADEPASPLSVLSGEGQAALINAMSAKTRTPAALRAELNTPISPPIPERLGQPVVDPAQRLLIATLSRPSTYMPGDRIMRAMIVVRPRNFTFGGYSIAQTDRQTIDITTLNRTSSTEASLSATGTPAAVPVSATGSLKGSRTIETTTKLQEAPEKLTVDILPSCMRIVQEGSHGVDLTGNTRIKAAIITETPPETCDLPDSNEVGAPGQTPIPASLYIVGPGLTFDNGRPSFKGSPGAVRTYPQEPLIADVTLKYVLRRIDRGGASYNEGEQAVTLLTGEMTGCQVVLSASQFLPPLYAVYQLSPRVPITITPPNTSTPMSLVFTDRETAKATANWISSTHTRRLGPLSMNGSERGLFEADSFRPPTVRSGCS